MSVSAPAAVPAHFHWDPQPAAQQVLDGYIAEFLRRSPMTRLLADRMRDETGTRFPAWIDFIRVPETDEAINKLVEVGFSHRPVHGASQRYIHEGAIFPAVIFGDGPLMRVGLKVESVADFLAAWAVPNDSPISGEPWCQLRMACAFRGDNTELVAVERHGYRGFSVPQANSPRSIAALRHLEAFRRRRRDWPEDRQGFEHVHSLADAAIAELGVNFACDLFFWAERDFWHRRNRAAQFQKLRQDRLGLGWANHDHHTYRCSREHFPRLVELLEKFGFKCRERFYAGAEAGWGAQVLEQSECGITIFADVDLDPDELAGDFAHTPLAYRPELGTVGLWVGLHGESILQAGMHHLECEFDYEALTKQLEQGGFGVMDPFTKLPYLRQAFTVGETWPVKEKRISRLLERRQITPEQAEQFGQHGAIGSHLENLERNDGYKGFNQKGVSDIIRRTDARLTTYEALA